MNFSEFIEKYSFESIKIFITLFSFCVQLKIYIKNKLKHALVQTPLRVKSLFKGYILLSFYKTSTCREFRTWPGLMPRNKIKAKFYNICALIGKPIEILIFVENSKKSLYLDRIKTLRYHLQHGGTCIHARQIISICKFMICTCDYFISTYLFNHVDIHFTSFCR